MLSKGSRIVVDTNIWISFLIGKKLRGFEDVLFEKEVTVVYSLDLINEILDVVSRPKFKKYFGETEVVLVKGIFGTIGEEVSVVSKIDICRDPKDNFLLALCKDGEADFLITGDDDLLDLVKYEKTWIVSYKDIKN